MRSPVAVAMTPRQRFLAALNLEPVDRLPFWPKLSESYAPAQRMPFREMDLDELFAWFGGERHLFLGSAVADARPDGALRHDIRGGRRTTTYATRHGELVGESRYDHGSRSWHPTVFPVRDLNDLHRLTAWYEDARPELNREALDRARQLQERAGETACTAVGVGRSPLMAFLEFHAGVEGAHYLLNDHEADCLALFAAEQRVILATTELVVEHHPADAVYLIEDTSTTLLSPSQYRRYNRPQIEQVARRVTEAGRPMMLHMCGHLKRLLPDLAGLPVRGFEAFTAPPVGDTTLADGRAACPDFCLIGGTSAALWMQPAAAIIARLEADLEALPHHRGVVVSSAGVMPPAAVPETIRAVLDWLRDYPVRC